MISYIDRDVDPVRGKYPYLGEFDDGMIVLFTAPEVGFVVYVTSPVKDYEIGEYGEGWCEGDAKPFEGRVFLSN